MEPRTDLAEVTRTLRERGFRGRAETDHPLAPLTTYRLGGPASLYLEPLDAGDLELLAGAAESLSGLEVLVLGRGSNLVVSDDGWPGLVVRMGPGFAWAGPDGPSGLRAGGALALPQLANSAARRGLAGVEFMVSIPGSLGGGVRMNAGAHGGAISDHLASATLFHLDTFELETRPAAGLGLGYRTSNLTERHLVVDAAFDLVADDPAAIRSRMDDYRRHRAATQPGALQNAGSVFKNPEGDHAGRLVVEAGLKGARCGGVAVSSLHANFFVAGEGARAQDVYDLVHLVRSEVQRRSGVSLTPEVRFVGSFHPAGRPRTEEVAGDG
ncbi:MAG: UDP-N-acetylmuramate dehydrogenase [Actinomycetota bacterium]